MAKFGIDGRKSLLKREPGGIGIYFWYPDFGWSQNNWDSPAWSDAAGWNLQQHYETIQLADIDGDGQAELFGIGPNGLEIWKYDKTAARWFRPTAQFPPFTDSGTSLRGTAYKSLSQQLTRDTDIGQVDDLRRVYKSINKVATFTEWVNHDIGAATRPDNVSAAEWTAVTGQIAAEAEL